ncbi:MAG: hypothetical protein AAF957_04065 [Planctomycetota bacterium]
MAPHDPCPSRGARTLPLTRAAARLLSVACALTCAVSCTTPRRTTEPEFEDWRVPPVVGEAGRIFGLSGSFASRNGNAEREWFSVRATIEEFLTDRQAIGAFVLGQYVNRTEFLEAERQAWIGGHYRLHHHFDERASIYVGPAIGVARYEDARARATAFAWGVNAGFRYWLTDRTAFTVEPTWLRSEFEDKDGGPTDDLLVLWGLAFSL